MRNFIYILLFISSLGFSQNGYIEVEVNDTINLIPKSFEYNILINSSGLIKYDEESEYNSNALKIKTNEKLSELETFLKKRKYTFKQLRNGNYEINNIPTLSLNGYVVILNNLESLKKLISDLDELDFVTGSVGEIDYSDENLAEELLLEKLINKAKLKAAKIAKLSNIKLGNILEVKEVKQIDNFTFSVMDIYANTKRSKNLYSENEKLYGQINKALVVKFKTE